MKSLRLLVAAAAVAAAVLPATASAGNGCTIHWEETHVPVVGSVRTPYCAW